MTRYLYTMYHKAHPVASWYHDGGEPLFDKKYTMVSKNMTKFFEDNHNLVIEQIDMPNKREVNKNV